MRRGKDERGERKKVKTTKRKLKLPELEPCNLDRMWYGNAAAKSSLRMVGNERPGYLPKQVKVSLI